MWSSSLYHTSGTSPTAHIVAAAAATATASAAATAAKPGAQERLQFAVCSM
jgi:hypothetical protein